MLLFSLNTYAQTVNPCDCAEPEGKPTETEIDNATNGNALTNFTDGTFIITTDRTINSSVSFGGTVTLIIDENVDVDLTGINNYNQTELTVYVRTGASFKIKPNNLNNRIFNIFNEGNFEFDGNDTVNLGASSVVFNDEDAFFLSDGEFNIQTDNNLNDDLSGEVVNFGKMIFDQKIDVINDMEVCNTNVLINVGELSMDGILRNTGDIISTEKLSIGSTGIGYNCGRLRTTKMDDLTGSYYNYCLTILDDGKLAMNASSSSQVLENNGVFVINGLFEVGSSQTVNLNDMSRVYASGITLNTANNLTFDGNSHFSRSTPSFLLAQGSTEYNTFISDCIAGNSPNSDDMFDIESFSDASGSVNINGSPQGSSGAIVYLCNFSSGSISSLTANGVTTVNGDCPSSGFLISRAGNSILRFTSNLKKSSEFSSIVTNLDFSADCKKVRACLELTASEKSPALSNYKVWIPSDLTVSNIQVTYDGSNSSVFPTNTGNSEECIDGNNGAIVFTVTTIGSGFNGNGFKLDDFGFVDNCTDRNEVDDSSFGTLKVSFDLEQSTVFGFNDLVLNVDPKASNDAANLDFIRLACGNVLPVCITDISLPIQLISFNAKKNENSVLLEWETASEIDNKLYEVQHSVDGINFQKLGEVFGNGSSEQIIAYEYEDQEPVMGMNFYRLKQVDFDGGYEYSSIVNINFNPSEKLKLIPYPQPNTSQLFIKNLRLKTLSEVDVKIYDLTGNLILTDHLISNHNQIDTSSLRAGIYIVKIMYEGKTESFRMVKASIE